MNKSGWLVSGSNADIELYETRLSDNDCRFGDLLKYEQAKEAAIRQLEEHIQPYMDKISELKADCFKQSGKLPDFKAWFSEDSWSHKKMPKRSVVVAKTKKRAQEILEISRLGFQKQWSECNGSWWYHLALAEGYWIEEEYQDIGGTGKFQLALTREQAIELAEQHMVEFRKMRTHKLLSIAGQTFASQKIALSGTQYYINTTIRFFDDGKRKKITVVIHIDDFLSRAGRYNSFYTREWPLSEVPSWRKFGF